MSERRGEALQRFARGCKQARSGRQTTVVGTVGRGRSWGRWRCRWSWTGEEGARTKVHGSAAVVVRRSRYPESRVWTEPSTPARGTPPSTPRYLQTANREVSLAPRMESRHTPDANTEVRTELLTQAQRTLGALDSAAGNNTKIWKCLHDEEGSCLFLRRIIRAA